MVAKKLAVMLALETALLGAATALAQETQAPPAPGWLEAKVLLVGDDLAVRPVPKKPFRIDCAGESDPDCGLKEALVTSFDGTFRTTLPPGSYILASAFPVEFEGDRFAWSVPFEVVSGETTVLELSNDNATVEEASAEPPIPTEGAIFRKVRPSVFKVVAEQGHGSGFLVDPAGLVLTNHHVVTDSDYLAVKVDEGRKYPAVLVAQDPKNDIAVLRVHPDAAAGLEPLVLAQGGPDQPAVTVGDRVLAVGSPLATETILTTGIVSKVEDGALYSDVNINPGNSGGPLFNMLGEVVGINTFGVSGESGPGMSGVVRIHVALPVLAEARSRLQEDPPAGRLLPVEPAYRFAADRLRETALATNYDPKAYHIEAGKVDVQFLTPLVLACLEVEGEKAAAKNRDKRSKPGSRDYEAGKDFYEWRRYAGDYQAVVRVLAVPEIGPTKGSLFGALLMAATTGLSTGMNYKFKTDFDRMELLRDGVVVEPIHPGRAPQVVNVEGGMSSMNDLAYFGVYEYPPEAFRPGAKLVLRVYEQGKPTAKDREIPPALLNRLAWEFKPYFDATEPAIVETAEASPPVGGEE